MTVEPALPLPLPDPPLADDLVLLRPWSPADAPLLGEDWGDPEVVRWTGVPSGDRSAARARAWISGEAERREHGLALDLAVTVDGVPVGEVGISHLDPVRHLAEVGWWTAPGWRRRGLASRAVRLVAAWAVTELCVERLFARVDPANPASVAVARNAGLERRGLASDGREVWATPGQLARAVVARR
jgi:RimJ/RimL family protein N-acetyltransferase